MFRQIAVYFSSIGLLALVAFRHPYHVGVTTVTYDKATKTADVRIKMIFHDLEPAVNKAAETDIDIKNHKNKTERDSLVYAYTFAHFEVLFGGKRAQCLQKGISFKDEYVFIDLGCSNAAGASEILMRNNMCFEMEPTQTNIFHLEKNGQPKETKKTVNPTAEASFKL